MDHLEQVSENNAITSSNHHVILLAGDIGPKGQKGDQVSECLNFF